MSKKKCAKEDYLNIILMVFISLLTGFVLGYFTSGDYSLPEDSAVVSDRKMNNDNIILPEGLIEGVVRNIYEDDTFDVYVIRPDDFSGKTFAIRHYKDNTSFYKVFIDINTEGQASNAGRKDASYEDLLLESTVIVRIGEDNASLTEDIVSIDAQEIVIITEI